MRDWWALGLPNPHHRRDPRQWLWRIRHRLTGPRRGCSCSRCFYHPRNVKAAARREHRRLERIGWAAIERRRRDVRLLETLDAMQFCLDNNSAAARSRAQFVNVMSSLIGVAREQAELRR